MAVLFSGIASAITKFQLMTKTEKGWLYIIAVNRGDKYLVKIGFTKDPSLRLTQIRVPFHQGGIKHLLKAEIYGARQLEKILHDFLKTIVPSDGDWHELTEDSAWGLAQ